ncbi:DUF6923 family protein [Chryseobacterium sp. 2R14A]|uniref:DUF6923 family protein n=1 Tax=Chryseobacterium sp. 2R14A TaxID=3380353 RepID=UPI003CFBBF7A
MKKQNLFLLLLLFMGNLLVFSQSCTINAGASKPICGTSTTLQATSGGAVSSSPPTWSILSKPAGATDPVFSNVNVLNPTVSGINSPGNYVFRITQPCTTGAPAVSDVTITAPGAITGFTAGTDITNIPATTGVATLNATIPAGYTASWTYYHIYSYEYNTTVNQNNAMMSNTTTATPTLTLTKKTDHDFDPAYRAVLRITSTTNPNCFYEDDVIIRFIPNPAMLFSTTYSQCYLPGTTVANAFFIDPVTTSPKFSTATANSSGNPTFGTIVTLTAVTQPAGGNIAYSRMENGRLYLTGITAIGPYVFDLDISNSTGSTTRRITYNYNGSTPSEVSYLDAAYPNQMQLYSGGGTGGAVYCSNLIGTNTPITYYFKINSADLPTTLTNATATAPYPGGTAPTIVQNGAGTMNRNVVVTPPAGGWVAGTYKISLSVGNGSCFRNQPYYIHISDSARPNVTVNDITVCYGGSGVVSANIPLPAVYKTGTYLQEFNGGRYDFTLVSGPAGAAAPAYQAASLRTLTNTSTVISNLNTPGEYVFRIKAVNGPNAGQFLEAEYACSGTSLEDTFSIFVTPQVNSNAGSNQNVVGTTTALNGNNPGAASTGAWSLMSKPAGVSDPVIVTPSAYNSSVTGLTQGTYVFRWTITTGTCTSSSDVTINVQSVNYCITGCNSNTYLDATDPNTIEYDNMVSTWHSTIVKEADGNFKIWGESTAPAGNTNTTTPTLITPANGYNYIGTPLKATAASNGSGFQGALLTTDGLYVWGTPGRLVSNSVKSNFSFGKITVNGKADGLPPGVAPTDVKMLFGSTSTLAITTCLGEAWVLSAANTKNGDGTSTNTGTVWTRVKTDANSTLDNVVAVRGNYAALFALTSEGKLYTWGSKTYINNGAGSARLYATEVSTPAGITPKMIGMTGNSTGTFGSSYFLLATNGKMYTMGDNTYKQLGDGTTTAQNNWIQPQKLTDQLGQGIGALDNIAWISPNEHDHREAAVNVLTNNGKQWAWGANDYAMIGGNGTSGSIDPAYMPGRSTAADGLKETDIIIAVETGAHTTINIKQCSRQFGYVGHYINGSIGYPGGDGSLASSKLTYIYSTAVVNICGASTTPVTKAELKKCPTATVDLSTALLSTIPANNVLEWWTTTNRAAGTQVVNPNAVGIGTYYAFYISTNIPACFDPGYSTVVVNNYQLTDPEYVNCTSVPFTCDTKFYLTQYGSAATDKTILYTLDNTTNPFTKTIIGESPAGMKVNGIGYNTVDNFLYGMRTDAANATHMVKIDATGTFTDLGAVTSLPAGGFNAGGFDNAGNYYIINFDSSNLYRINLSTNTATQITLSRSLKVNDIAFDSTTNLFYGYEQSTGRLVSINTSGVVTNVGSPSALGNVFFGAMYSDSNGDIFGNEDDGSGFYQFNKTTGQATKISESISAFGNDGANCSNAVITFPADLSITKTDGKTTYVPASATTYTIVVSNNSGAYGVLGATVSDPVPAGIPAANVSYSVPVLTGGATTSITGPQTGALNDVVGLPIGGTITYTVTVNVPLTFTGNLTNTVTVTPPVNSTDPNNSNNTATDTNTNGVCYKPGITAGTALDTKVGITTLSRAGATDVDNWPMARKGGWVALESKTKGFVPNRVAFTDADANPATPDSPVGIAAANFREGMMVYDTTNKCLKVYTMKDGDTSMAWHCVTTQTCPD